MRVFQNRVFNWAIRCFGVEIANNKIERNHRFLEEALELVQTCDCTIEEAHQLVDYVFSRPIGEKDQEVGGVMVTLAALCASQDVDMEACSYNELYRINNVNTIKKIREKQKAKPKHSPLAE